MKTFLVYDLDTGLPVGVGEQTNEQNARYSITGVKPQNLIAEEINDNAQPIQKNSKPNPRIMSRKDFNNLTKKNSNPCAIAAEVFGTNQQAMERAQRYSKFISCYTREHPQAAIPTFDEWLFLIDNWSIQ